MTKVLPVHSRTRAHPSDAGSAASGEPASAAPPPSVGQPVATTELDLGTSDVRCSPALSALLGLGQTFSGQPAEDLLARVHEEDRAVLRATARSAARGEGPVACTVRVTDLRGRQRTVVAVGEATGGLDGRSRLRGCVVDVTEPVREQARGAVAASAAGRAAIEQVKGVLMLTLGVDDDEAFAVLRRCSNRHNVKLAVLAERIARRLPGLALHPDGARAALTLLLEHGGEDPLPAGDGRQDAAPDAAPHAAPPATDAAPDAAPDVAPDAVLVRAASA
jgi:hypothetical protein